MRGDAPQAQNASGVVMYRVVLEFAVTLVGSDIDINYYYYYLSNTPQ